MELFDTVFNRAAIYDYFFFNVKTVLEYPTVLELKEKNPRMYERWCFIAENSYNPDKIDLSGDVFGSFYEEMYNVHAVKHAEFIKIIAISYAIPYKEGSELKRNLYRIANNDELIVIETFMEVLHKISSECKQRTPVSFNILCGYEIVNFDIPTLIKRFIYHKDAIANKNIPLILKICLSSKPWDSKIIDIANVWKFGGFYNNNTLMCISDFLNLKKSVDLLTAVELNKFYWDNVGDDETLQYAIDEISLQSATQTNLSLQIMNNLSKM